MAKQKQLKRHPWHGGYRDLTEKERREMEESLETVGLLDPITIFEGKVLDGWHRYLLCLALKITPLLEHYDGPTDEQSVLRFCFARNGARRHLTTKEMQQARQRRIKRVMQRSEEGASTREIAEEEGVSQTRVCDDLKEGRQKELEFEPQSEQGCSAENTPPSEVEDNVLIGACRDGEGCAVSDELVDVFAARPQMEELLNGLKALRNDLLELPYQLQGMLEPVTRYLKAAITDLGHRIPWIAGCPFCPEDESVHCYQCDDRGWLPKAFQLKGLAKSRVLEPPDQELLREFVKQRKEV